MKNLWLNHLNGLVEVEANGIDGVRFVNQLVREGAPVQHMQHVEVGVVRFWIRLGDVELLRQVRRKYDVKIHFKKRRGLPFFIRKLRTYPGLVFGAAAFVCLIFVLSNIVWSIQIEGASPATEAEIRQELDKLDVRTGKFNFLTGDVDYVQKELTDKISNVTWVGVELRGSVYQLTVVEKKQPAKDKSEVYGSLIATKEAYIIRPEVESGQLKVTEHQLVKKGELLVSGYIGEEGEADFVGAKGEVLGETWYQTTSEVPLDTDFVNMTGNYEEQHRLKLFGSDIPIWGFTKPKYKESDTESYTTYLHIWKWKLPIGVTKQTVREVEHASRKLSEEEANMIARDTARRNAIENMPYDAKIIKENVLRRKVTKDKLKVVVHFEVIENIATGVKKEDKEKKR